MSSTQGDLVPVHGGADELVDRIVPLSLRRQFLEEANGLPSIAVSNADLSTVHRLADGALSPLEGPMKGAAYDRALDEGVILAGGRRYAWTIPISLPVSNQEADALGTGCSAAVATEEGEIVAILEDVEVFDWDKLRYVTQVYATERMDHPGARIVADDPRSKLIGGSLRALPQVLDPEYGQYMLSPRMARALFRDKKWERALAFQTRNPLHRAHEYALVAGAELFTGNNLIKK